MWFSFICVDLLLLTRSLGLSLFRLYNFNVYYLKYFDTNYTILEIIFFICCTFVSTITFFPIFKISFLFFLDDLWFLSYCISYWNYLNNHLICTDSFLRDSYTYPLILEGFNFSFVFFSDFLFVCLFLQVLDTLFMFSILYVLPL